MLKNATQKAMDSQYTDIRARLLERGYTLRSFAIQNNLPVQTVYSAARRKRAGVKSTRIYRRIQQVAYAQ